MRELAALLEQAIFEDDQNISETEAITGEQIRDIRSWCESFYKLPTANFASTVLKYLLSPDYQV